MAIVWMFVLQTVTFQILQVWPILIKSAVQVECYPRPTLDRWISYSWMTSMILGGYGTGRCRNNGAFLTTSPLGSP